MYEFIINIKIKMKAAFEKFFYQIDLYAANPTLRSKK